MQFVFKTNSFQIERYPETSNRSLKPWSAADEYLLKYVQNIDLSDKKIVCFNDRFGLLQTILNKYNPINVISYKSQQKACLNNLENNGISSEEISFNYLLEGIDNKVDLVLLKAPKSLELLHIFFERIKNSFHPGTMVICSFMTRNYSPQIIKIAEKYFSDAKQSLAYKKARVLLLKEPKSTKNIDIINKIEYKGNIFRQYFGVFSSGNIDYATQHLISKLDVRSNDKKILDLASGNGVIAKFIQKLNPQTEIHLLDDSYLAIESSKLNIEGDNIFYHFDNSMDIFEDNYFDLIVTNPPFHFEYENNIEVSINLFKEARRCLKQKGRLQIVANRHLNYKTHLEKIFGEVILDTSNSKFVIYSCWG